MGNISDALQNLKDEIRSSTEDRKNWRQELSRDNKVSISEIRSDTHNLIERFHREDTERKGAVSEMLTGFQAEDTERKGAVNEMLTGFQAEDTERKGAVNEMLTGFQAEDTERKGAVSEMVGGFQAEDTERKGAVSEMVGGFRKANSELREEVASDLRQAHQIWTEGLKKIKPEAVREEVRKKREVEAAPPPSEEKILKVITGHPEGIRLVDIGNELGVDWRILIGSSKSLVDTGQVEKIENMYYPKKEE